MPISEADVLKPVEPSITDSDDWEIFVLSDAHVVYESNGKPASLLSAYADTPLKVVGRLEAPGRGQVKYLLKKPYKPVEIDIRNVARFSYGEMTDGAYVIWAQGKAGWFEIRPADHYKPIFDDMVQAVELLYFVSDIYNEPRKRGGGPSAQLIFKEYAEDERFTCSDPAVAEQIFDRHHTFLMMCFLNRAQDIGWSTTPLYQHFRKRHPQDFETCKARIEGRYSQIQPTRQTRTSRSSPAPAPVSAPTPKPVVTTTKSRTARGKAATPKPGEPPKKDDNWWEAAALFEFMQKAVNQRVLRVARNHITLERVAELIVKRYEIDELETAQNVLLVHAQNLCYMMDHPRRQSIKFFASEPIYQELTAEHNLSAAEQRRAEGVALRPRRDHATLRGDKSESSEASDEEVDDVSTPVRRPQGRRKKGRLSVLRPRSSKFSGKSKGITRETGKAGKGKAPIPDSEAPSGDSDAEGSGSSSDSSDELGIDTPTQGLSPGREKRKLDEMDADRGEEKGRRKRAAERASLTPDSPPTAAESDDEDDVAAALDEPPLPLRYRPSNVAPNSRPTSSTKEAVVASIVSTPLPTYEPNGSRDSWICSFDGCSQRIYGCSKEIGRRLITEHLEDHTKGREKVVGILWREQDKLHLPVSNLIKKIREMSEASAPLFPIPGASTAIQPRPIQRPV
ncbi:uncharacterized protein K460DRAFT_402425 [Cucurbitaria berberidis CBS 394.84]|uniref:DNA (cytosine-5)-methyltransferase 1 replication foci domain-containing protein n=1 Tax=Cucurbitaria berberidis CBS 394.84 TaxID=1168544 RepID=A0A9P4GL33_9PLEO|nr:uncharacterized protein K460DRAFT_402425 [Cucurbitaria berberidis CBS 394.84]KAF1847061.1 hypothetical protein K460DRAFT_402425 [Cucurbitaria berberidis CBS 394.84]